MSESAATEYADYIISSLQNKVRTGDAVCSGPRGYRRQRSARGGTAASVEIGGEEGPDDEDSSASAEVAKQAPDGGEPADALVEDMTTPSAPTEIEDPIARGMAEMEDQERRMRRQLEEHLHGAADPPERPEAEEGSLHAAARSSKVQPSRSVFPKSPKGQDIVIDGGEVRGFRHGESPCPPLGEVTHPGVDIAPPVCGVPVRSFADGKVIDLIATATADHFTALGYMVMVEHNRPHNGKPVYSIYLHLQDPPAVRRGEAVFPSKVIGKVGKTGKTIGGCHTHFEIRYFGSRFLDDPAWNLRNGRSNIYGKARLGASSVLSENWLDPEEAFRLFPGGM